MSIELCYLTEEEWAKTTELAKHSYRCPDYYKYAVRSQAGAATTDDECDMFYRWATYGAYVTKAWSAQWSDAPQVITAIRTANNVPPPFDGDILTEEETDDPTKAPASC